MSIFLQYRLSTTDPAAQCTKHIHAAHQRHVSIVKYLFEFGNIQQSGIIQI